MRGNVKLKISSLRVGQNFQSEKYLEFLINGEKYLEYF